MFFKMYLKLSWISDAEYNPSLSSNSSFYGGVDIWNLLFFVILFFVFLWIVNADTARKVSKDGVSGPYFFCIQTEYGE